MTGELFIKFSVLSQGEYNDRQRAKRVQEFAPPSSYKIDVPSDEEECKGLRFTTAKKKRNFVENIPIPIDAEFDAEATSVKSKLSKRQGTEIPPPPSYDKATTSVKSKNLNLNESLEMGLDRLRRKDEMKRKRKEPSMDEII